MSKPRNKSEPDAAERSPNASQAEGAAPINAQSFRHSRRQLLSQGVNAGLGLMLFPQLSGLGNGNWRMEWRSLLSLATAPTQKPGSATVGQATASQAPITVTIHFTAKPNQAEALVAQLRRALPQARQAPGCRDAQLYLVSDQPNSAGQQSKIVLFKSWDSRSAQAQYLQQEQRSGQLAKLLALVEGEPMVEYWEFQPY